MGKSVLRSVWLCCVVSSVAIACVSLSGIAGNDLPADAGTPEAGPGTDGSTNDSPVTPLPDAACSADLLVDPLNCGRCGHDCLGGGCSAGRCRAVKMIDNGSSAPSAVALLGADLYWVSYNNGLGKCTATTCDGGTFNGFPMDNPVAVAATSSELVWTASTPFDNDAGVFRCLVPGCANRARVGVSSPPTELATQGGDIYWLRTVGSGGDVMRCSPNVACVVIGSSSEPGRYIAVDTTDIYWTTAFGVWRCLASNCSSTVLRVTTAPVNNAYGIAVNTTHVIWTESLNTIGSGIVRRCPKAGCAQPETIATALRFPIVVVADDTTVYIGDDKFSGTRGRGILSCAATGCGDAAVPIETDVDFPRSMKASATSVYWTDYNLGRLWRVAK